MTKLERMILEEFEDAEGTISDMDANLLPFGFDSINRANSYQDKLNSNVLSTKGRSRS